MTELPINCCPGSTTPVSPHCIAEDYLMRQITRFRAVYARYENNKGVPKKD